VNWEFFLCKKEAKKIAEEAKAAEKECKKAEQAERDA
jgi:hypothetical protein